MKLLNRWETTGERLLKFFVWGLTSWLLIDGIPTYLVEHPVISFIMCVADCWLLTSIGYDFATIHKAEVRDKE